jgi:hypothetical protein
MYQLFHDWLHSWDYLKTTRSVPDDCHCQIFIVEILWPVCAVDEAPFEAVEARDIRPLPTVQDATAVNKEIAPVIENPVVDRILYLHMPNSKFLFPCCSYNAVAQLDVLSQLVFIDTMLKISFDLVVGGEEGVPVRIGFPGKLIVMRS